MSVENHVVSLETAKRMKELGWRKETQGSWYRDDFYGKGDIFFSFDVSGTKIVELAYAPLATEIMEELPKCIYYNKHGFLLEVCATVESVNEFYCDYTNSDNMNHPDTYTHYHANLAEALALLWCELKEKGII